VQVGEKELAQIERAKRRDGLLRSLKNFVEGIFHVLTFPLAWLFALLFVRRGRRAESPQERIIVIQRILRLGDTIVSLPTLSQLRRLFPHATIDVLADRRASPILDNHPHIDRVILCDKEGGLRAYLGALRTLRGNRYTQAYVLVTDALSILLALLSGAPIRVGYNCNNRGLSLSRPLPPPPTINRPLYAYPRGESGPPIVNLWLALVGAAPDSWPYPRLRLSPQGLSQARALVAEIEPPRVLLHPGSANESYLWSLARWRELAGRLLSAGFRVMVGGSEEERALAEALCADIGDGIYNLAGKADVAGYLALVSLADVLISVDTFAGHIASSLGVPLVVLFGPGDESIWKPVGPGKIAVVAGESPCRGCKRPNCFQQRHYCMEAIKVDKVWGAFMKVFSNG